MAATPLSSPAPTSRDDQEPRARARAARRQALLETAETVFAERGFTGATMAEIASRAGYSAGNLYNVFEGKDALFSEVLSLRAAQVLELVREALRPSGSLGDTIDRYVGAVLELVEKHRGFFVMLMQTTPEFEWHASRTHDGVDLRAELEGVIEQTFRDAMKRGEIPTGNPRVYACMLHGTMNVHVSHWVRSEGSPKELWEIADDLKRFLRRGLGVPS